MKVLDLFSGLGGFSQAFVDAGHEVLRIDNDKRFKDIEHTIIEDVFNIKYILDIDQFDVILASPPCNAFSVASISHHWTGGKGAYIPKTSMAKLSIQLVEFLVDLLKDYKGIFFIENPRGMMRTLPVMDRFKRHTITLCQYGDNRMKPTDIWTNSDTWKPRPMCKRGDPCHERAPRGSRTGTQGLKNAQVRALLPLELSEDILRDVESKVYTTRKESR